MTVGRADVRRSSHLILVYLTVRIRRHRRRRKPNEALRLVRPTTEQVHRRDYYGRRRATQPPTPYDNRASPPAQLRRPTTRNSAAESARRPSKSSGATASTDDAQLGRLVRPTTEQVHRRDDYSRLRATQPRRPVRQWSVVPVVRGP